MKLSNQERYDSLDGLRAISAIGIAAMHVYSNFGCKFDSFLFSNIIGGFGQYTLLFMIISGFSMCCGYYTKFQSGNIDLNNFYKKRYKRILPFFTVLVLIDFIVSPSVNLLYEVFANLTMCFGFLPSRNFSVIGVGWFLGTVFVFYTLFPFFCFLIRNKKSA